MGPVRIGCSGWNYRHWRGIFYPEGLAVSRWFAFYAEHFDTVEINNSFYRLPAPEVFDRWREAAPPGFCYAVKANRFLTQAKKLKDCEEPLARMLAAMECLGDRLGPLLFQLPPRFRINLDRLQAFLEILPKRLVTVFEFRDNSWHVPETLALLDSHGAGFCVHDMPGSATERWAAGPIAYVRFHGTQGKYHGRYAEPVLREWTKWIVGQARAGRPVYCYFNNDISGHAIEDAKTLQSMVASALGADTRSSAAAPARARTP